MEILKKMFTFLKDKNILQFVKKHLVKLVWQYKDELKPKLEEYIQNKTPELEQFVIDLIMNKLEFGFPMCMFKGIIKKTVIKNLDKLVEHVLSKIDEI